MKNWPGTPGSRQPRSRRSSRYGPTVLGPDDSKPGAVQHAPGARGRPRCARPGDRLDRRDGAADGRDARDARDERRLADEVAVGARAAPGRRVDDEVAPPAADEIDDRRPLPRFGHLADALDRNAGGGERRGGAGCGAKREAEPGEAPAELDGGRLVGVAHREERDPRVRQRPAGGALGLGERGREVGRARHHLAGRAHLRARARRRRPGSG